VGAAAIGFAQQARPRGRKGLTLSARHRACFRPCLAKRRDRSEQATEAARDVDARGRRLGNGGRRRDEWTHRRWLACGSPRGATHRSRIVHDELGESRGVDCPHRFARERRANGGATWRCRWVEARHGPSAAAKQTGRRGESALGMVGQGRSRHDIGFFTGQTARSVAGHSASIAPIRTPNGYHNGHPKRGAKRRQFGATGGRASGGWTRRNLVRLAAP
jgi:hypothetical protein